jgi:hypothetical protein
MALQMACRALENKTGPGAYADEAVVGPVPRGKVFEIFREVIRRTSRSPGIEIPEWNDRRGRSLEDVRLALKLASEKWEEAVELRRPEGQH